MVKNGSFGFLLLELIWADQLADILADLPIPQYWHLVVKNGNFTFLLLELIRADQLADLPPVLASSGQEWQFQFSTVRAHMGRSTGSSTPHRSASRSERQCQIFAVRAHMGRSTGSSTPIDLPVDLKGNVRFLLLGLIWADQLADIMADLSIPQYCHLVVKNGNFTFLLLELIQADQLADLPPVLASSGQEWQFHISAVRAHTGRSTADLPPVLASSGQEWQFQFSTVRAHMGISTGRSTP